MEDLANSEEFSAWRKSAMQNDVHLGSVQHYRERTGREAAFLGTQRGSVGSKHAIDAVVGFGSDPDEHYTRAGQVSVGRADPWCAKAVPTPICASQRRVPLPMPRASGASGSAWRAS